ncbi:Lipoprotein releasing system transmembrane protein LolC, partial [Salmonella enterica subsp. enterica serovar Senftenberg str. A4-543]
LLGAALGALLASQLNNLMPIIGAFLDGAALPVAIEPLQVIVIALVAMANCHIIPRIPRNGHCAAFYALSFLARCRHSTR